MKVYLIESVGMASGRVFAIFCSREDAKRHQKTIDEDTIIVERTCFTSRANNPGHNR